MRTAAHRVPFLASATTVSPACSSCRLRARLVLLLAEQRVQTHSSDLDHLEAASGNISYAHRKQKRHRNTVRRRNTDAGEGWGEGSANAAAGFVARTLSLSGATESSDEHLIVLIDEVERTVIGDESGHLLAVLDELNTASLTNGGVRLHAHRQESERHDQEWAEHNREHRSVWSVGGPA